MLISVPALPFTNWFTSVFFRCCMAALGPGISVTQVENGQADGAEK